MQRQFFQSQVTDIKNSFAETFGRGCLIKQPSFSQRNNFQRQKMNADKAGRYPYRQENQQKNKEINQQYVYKRKQVQEVKKYIKETNKEFEKIDQINSKIYGLIKSISASCHKKTPLDIKLDIVNDRGSSKKAQVLINNYAVNKENVYDYQKTEKKINQDTKKQYPQFKAFESYMERRVEKYSNSNLLSNLQQKILKNGQEDGFVDLNQRIKKINDKISNYENRIKYGIKGNHEEKPVNSKPRPPLRDNIDYDNIHNKQLTKIQRKESQLKVDKQRMKYILNEKQNELAMQKYAQSTQLKRVGKDINQSNSISTLFNKKMAHKEQKSGKKQYSNTIKQVNEPTNSKKASGQIRKNLKPQVEESPIELINEKLLSYKTQFLKELVKQIRFDQDFRHAKHMFGGIDELFDEGNLVNSQKWNKLQNQLKKQGFNLPLSEVLEIFMPRDDEIDPFMSVSHSHEEMIHGLIYSYRTCEKNWNENIYHNWSIWELKQSKFTAENLDQSKRGSLALEDLTFYLNTELDGNYRNRDLMLIFNRLKPTKGKAKESKEKIDQCTIKFKDMIEKLLST